MIRIRPEQDDDIASITNVTLAAFSNWREGYEPMEHRIIKRLRQLGDLAISLVAVTGDNLVGHVAMSPVRISSGDQGWFGLGPVSVLPDWQRRGIGSLLIDTALDQLKVRNAAGCVVLGEPDLYQRFGFRHHSGLMLPGFPAEYFLAQSFRNEVPTGTVTYSSAFGLE